MPAPHIVHFSSVHQVTDVRVFLKECRSLAKAGYRVTLVARGAESGVSDGVRQIAVSNSALDWELSHGFDMTMNVNFLTNEVR